MDFQNETTHFTTDLFTNTSKSVVNDNVTNFNETFDFNELFNMSWARYLMPCSNWREPQHLLFQVANGCFFVSCLTPDTRHGILVMHTVLILGFLLYSTWAWNVICAPDIFSWTFGFTLLNMGHVFHCLYQMRPIRLDPELEIVFRKLFQPLRVNRLAFKKFVSPEYAQIFTLHAGEAYALQNLTRTDRLSLLLCGKAQVISDRSILHWIENNEFLDSPEFESSRATLEDKFRVSIVAATACRYISWQRSTLEYLLVKETHLAAVLGILIAKDVTSKVYAMNKKLAVQKGRILDVRLPSIANYYNPNEVQEDTESVTSPQLSLPKENTPVKKENGIVAGQTNLYG